ncbi:hypothetical protein [Amycolatopsis eburnea]|uniref:Uncharacterized protein n=1 Tax=Amycolatopsis eburnea TaxID=2267691 RepID=A0A427SV85_9PSEU|nr:hypothetical protein [Amycolatopsis eburnea]RSD07968.1 hypothetical protein EIY87_45145 [Amycolatopsis eburnea]
MLLGPGECDGVCVGFVLPGLALLQDGGKLGAGKKRTVSVLASLVPVVRPLVTGRQVDKLMFTTGRDQSLRGEQLARPGVQRGAQGR